MLCFVGSRIFGLVSFKLHSTGRYSCITAPQLLFYSQHWTRLANIQTNTQARLELTKQGLQSLSERDWYMLDQNFPSQWCRELSIMLCAHGPVSEEGNEWVSLFTNTYGDYKKRRQGDLPALHNETMWDNLSWGRPAASWRWLMAYSSTHGNTQSWRGGHPARWLQDPGRSPLYAEST